MEFASLIIIKGYFSYIYAKRFILVANSLAWLIARHTPRKATLILEIDVMHENGQSHVLLFWFNYMSTCISSQSKVVNPIA